MEEVSNNLVSTFFIGDTRWGVDIMHTQEVIRIPAITPVFNSVHYIEGVINLRGKIVTIISLSKKLDVNTSTITEESRIIILNQDDELVGIIVDEISDVVEVTPETLQPSPATLNGVKGENIEGIYHHKDFTIALLNIDAMFLVDEENQ